MAFGYLSQSMAGFIPGSAGAPSVGSVDEALRNAADWACIKVKAQSIAALPIDVVRRVEGGRREPVPPPLMVSRPSGIVSRRTWVKQLASSMFSDGNGFGQVVAVDGEGRPTQIETVDPSVVTNRQVVDGVGVVHVNGVAHKLWPHGDIWHVPGEFVMPGSPFGLSPIWYGSRSTGTALAAEDFGGKFLVEGGHPHSILRPERDPGPDGAKALKAAWLAATSGTSREPAVLPQTVGYERIQIDPSDSQFIDLMRFEIEQACRRHGVPPSMVYAAVSGQNVTYTNVTQADLHFLKHTLLDPVTTVEDAWSALISGPVLDPLRAGVRVVKFNLDAILRPDTLARYQIHQIALNTKMATVDERRALEDLAPFGGDFAEPGIPADQSDDPEQLPLPLT